MINIADPTGAVRISDIEEFAGIMQKMRATGMTPSKIIDELWDAVIMYARGEFPAASAIDKYKIAAHILEQSAKTVGIHAEERRKGKEEKQK